MRAPRTRWSATSGPPYQVRTPDGLSGLSVEIVRAVYHELGMEKPDIQVLPWKRVLDKLRYGEADALFSASRTPSRELFLRYPEEPLFDSPWYVWTKAGRAINKIDDLKGKRIGVVMSYYYTPEFWEFINANCVVSQTHDDDANFRQLSLDRIDATVAELGNGLLLARDINPWIKAVPSIKIKEDGLYIAFNRKASEEFVQRFSDALKRFKESWQYDMLMKKYYCGEE